MTDQSPARPDEIAARAREAIDGAPDAAALERLRVAYLGQRSELMGILPTNLEGNRMNVR